MLKVPTVLIDGLSINMLVAGVVGIVIVLAYFAMARKGLRYKIIALALALFAFPLMGIAMIEQLSFPKEIALSWLKGKGKYGIAVHKTIIRPPERIELLIEENGVSRFFYVPWTQDLEQSLQEAMKKSQEGREGQLRFRYEKSLEDKPQFYSEPWPAPPSKDEKPQGKTFKFEQDI